jgi:hypothetical protein
MGAPTGSPSSASGRIELRLKPATSATRAVEYAVELHAGPDHWQTWAAVGHAAGDVEFGDWVGPGEGPPRWLCDMTRSVLRSVWRAHRDEVPEPRWPRRITRWRAEPEPRV